MQIITTPAGQTIEIRRTGTLTDFCVRDSDGRAVATVYASGHAADEYLNALRNGN